MTATSACTLSICSLLAAALLIAPTSAHAATESVVYSFKGIPNGYSPSSPLVKLAGKFYGVTREGGTGNRGTVYWATPDGRHRVIHTFLGGNDGYYPNGGLLAVGTTFYGTTQAGGGAGCGGAGCGTVYSVTPNGVYAVIYAFQGGSDGASSNATLINVGGTLYGTTGAGGSGNEGNVFSITPQGTETVLYAFKGGSDGSFPSSLITDGATLYGVTSGGGTGTGCGQAGCGTVFAVSLQGLKTTLYNFKNRSQGDEPFGRLLKVGNSLFGTTLSGGTQGSGTVFRLSLTGEHKVLHNFTQTDGASPFAGLTNVKGILYGTTINGGTTPSGGPGYGTVFSITPQGDFVSVYTFLSAPDGYAPFGELLDFNGTLYGTTFYGGNLLGNYCRTSGCGTVFSIQP